MARVGDYFALEIVGGVWAVGLVGWTHPYPAVRFGVLDAFWDHEPSSDDVARVGLWSHRQGRKDIPMRFLVSGDVELKVVAHDPMEPWEMSGESCRSLASLSELTHILRERWRTIHDREAWLAEQRVSARARGIAWRPPPNLAGWRFETKVDELFSVYPTMAAAIERLRRSLIALEGDPLGARTSIRNMITELNDYHRDQKPLDEEAGELLLRRITQLAHCVGISPSEVAHLSGHRTWPTAPLEPLHLGSASTLPTEKWRDRMASNPDLYSADGVDAVEAVLKAALSERSAKGFSGARANVLSWIQRTVVALNEVDQRFGQIDTQEREELVRWILGVAGGTFSDDPTDRWRTW